MTHDIEIFKHFNTILRDTEELRKKLDKENNRLCLGKKGKVPETKICFSQQYLKNGKLVTIDKKSNTKNEYRNQLATVYKYAKDPNTEQDGPRIKSVQVK